MKTICLSVICLLMIVSCKQENNNNIAYRIREKDFIPEGIAYSSTTQSFYVSSIHKTKIVQVDAESGEYKDFIPSGLLDMFYLGLFVDEKRNHLWACCNTTKKGDSHSMVIKFSLTTGELIKSYSFPDTVANTYNDLTEDNKGNVYFTDSDGQCVYRIDGQTDSVYIFFDGVEIAHPNGITISHNNKFLYIASNDKGIRVCDIEKREIIGEPDISIDSKGIDGLEYYENSLIGIQNEVKTKSDVKIVRYFLDDTGKKIVGMKIIDQDNPHFNIPTTCVIVDHYIYCLANSQLGNIGSDNEIINPDALNDVLILKYELK